MYKPKLEKSRYQQGVFTPKYPDKYAGKSDCIVYRSSYELKFMVYCDNHPDVIKWNSEEVIIPYIYSVDRKWHRYYLDFYVEYRDKKGDTRKTLIEVKPYNETIPPKQPKNPNDKKTQARYVKACLTYQKNLDKWDAAREVAKKTGAEFKIITEYSLGIKERKK